MNNKELTIFIPTYNRAEIIDETLAIMINNVSLYNIKIVVVDNFSSDNTKSVVSKHKNSYPQLYYYCNEKNIGADNNILKCYCLAETNYCWVLGDSYTIDNKSIKHILKILKYDAPDLLVLNSDRVKNIDCKEYYDVNKFLIEIGWHLDLTPVLIIKKEAVLEKHYNRYEGSNFRHVAMIVDYLISLDNPKIYWYSKSIINHTSGNKTNTSWWKNRFKIFAQNWTVTIFSLPWQIPISVKEQVIFDHSKYAGSFRVKDLLLQKIDKTLIKTDFTKHKKYIHFVTNTNLAIIYLISLTPIIILKFLLYIYRLFKRAD